MYFRFGQCLAVLLLVLAVVLISGCWGTSAPPGPNPPSVVTPPVSTGPIIIPDKASAKIIEFKVVKDADSMVSAMARVLNTGKTTLTGDVHIRLEGPEGSRYPSTYGNTIIQKMYLVPGKDMVYGSVTKDANGNMPYLFRLNSPGKYKVTVWIDDRDGNTLDKVFDYKNL